MDNIQTAEDQDKLIIQNSIKYLDRLTQIKELNVPTLKSLYRTKCRLMELRRHIFLPKQKPYRRCQQCFMDFSEGDTKFEVRPTKLSAFAKKVIAKVKKNYMLTSYQRQYYKKILKKFPNGFHKQNKLVLTCKFCEKETEVWMDKPKKKGLLPKEANTSAKKKKSRKKDKFCGLNKGVVSLLSSKKKNHTVNSDKRITTTTGNNNKLDTTQVFVVSKQSNMNTSVSMTNTRGFQTSDFIPLQSNLKRKQTIKFSRQKIKKNVAKPMLPGVLKSKEKLQKKNLSSLSGILKKANENKNKPTSKLKAFLAGL